MHSEVTTFKKQCVLGSRGLQPPPFSPRLNKRRSKIHFVGMHTKECEKSTEDKLDFCVWAQRRNPSDTQPSKGTDCCVLNSHHLSRAFPWAPCVYACAAPNFLFPPSCSVIHHERSRLCALPGNTIATGKVSPRRPPAFLSHTLMTRVHLLLLSPLLPISSSLPFSSPKPEPALLRRPCGFTWVQLTRSKALHRHGQQLLSADKAVIF